MAKYNTFKYGTAVYGGDALWIFYRTVNDLLNETNLAYINYTDLNRIENRMKELTEQLNKYKYSNHIITKTNWKKQTSTNELTNIPLKTELIRIKNNLDILVDSYYIFTTTPPLPNSLENLTIFTANNIEKILYDLHLLIKQMINSYKYCGTFNCGEEYI